VGHAASGVVPPARDMEQTDHHSVVTHTGYVYMHNGENREDSLEVLSYVSIARNVVL
jgi:hypothetical protein